jgi:hypothetical protein
MCAPRSNKLAKLKSDPKTQIERIRDVSPKYAALIERHAELLNRQDAALRESAPLAEEARRSQVSWVSQAPKPKPKPIVRHGGAVALVGDLLPEQPIEETSPPPPRPSWPGESRLHELGEEAEAIAEALKLLVPEQMKARKAYSKAVAAHRGGEYSEIVERIVDSAKALADAMIEHYKFLDGQRQDGVAYSNFQPLNLEVFGDPSEDFSPLKRLILDAVEKRHVGAGKIPNWMPVDIAYLQNGG